MTEASAKERILLKHVAIRHFFCQDLIQSRDPKPKVDLLALENKLQISSPKRWMQINSLRRGSYYLWNGLMGTKTIFSGMTESTLKQQTLEQGKVS